MKFVDDDDDDDTAGRGGVQGRNEEAREGTGKGAEETERGHRTSTVGETAGGGGCSLLNVITTGLKSASVNDLSGT